MDRRSEHRAEPISNRTSKKLLLPVLWLFLVLWFIKRTFPPHSLHVDQTNPDEDEEEEKKNSTLVAIGEATHVLRPYGTTQNTTYAMANITTSNKAAVIIETRASGDIVPIVLHFSAVLGPSWPIVIYTPAENFGSFSTSAALLRYQRIGRVVVRPLADGVFFPNWNSVSEFLTTAWLWEELAPAEHILLFQSDSVLCSNSVRSVDDFFEYDFIGAPIKEGMGQGYNGGLSLRSRSTVLKVLTDVTYAGGDPEDQWYYARMRELQARQLAHGMEEGVVNLPSVEIARTFAVETIDYPHPLGLQDVKLSGFSQEHANIL